MITTVMGRAQNPLLTQGFHSSLAQDKVCDFGPSLVSIPKFPSIYIILIIKGLVVIWRSALDLKACSGKVWFAIKGWKLGEKH